MKEMSLLLPLFGCSVLGQFLHLWIKLNALQKRANTAGIPFKPKELFEKDWTNIGMSLTANIALLVAYSELSSNFEMLSLWPKCLFLLSGYTGSSLVLSALSKTDKMMQNKIDLITTNTETTMYEWALPFEKETDLVQQSGGNLNIDSFAANEVGTVNKVANEIVFASEPSWAGQTFIRRDTTTYLSEPVRRPV